mgnify:CR=1 FL=1
MVDRCNLQFLNSLAHSANYIRTIGKRSPLQDRRLLYEQDRIAVHMPSQSKDYIVQKGSLTFIYRFLSSSVGFFNLSGCMVNAS